ncbi:PAS domain-containing sensor histidine kinase [Cohnella sp. REN36]|uniref:sensor histidine kinase n=1 Tax=Cohnella sp. REN36 TaxID=2887347 RepID=UPI001D147A62|nr:HAMP domain-containing sensor histidine kinase [Cohnella sp. REN36]MCC3374032.1 HAMP domain-containing histidine kinase [Cohnella sp. REN36]
MIFVWLALWAVALFLLVSDPRSSAIRRLAAVAFLGGTGALAAVVDAGFIPGLSTEAAKARWEPPLYRLQVVSALASYYGVPYAFLLFALAFRPAGWSMVMRRGLSVALLLPIALCLLLLPPYTEQYPISFDIVVWWAVPYIAFGAAHILLHRPRHAPFSPAYWIVVLAVLPPMLFLMTMNYLLPSLGWLRLWVYNTWIVGLAVAFFLLGLFTYGFMGTRLLFERRRLDSTLRAVTSGTAILNHAIKNDAGKIRLFGEKMKRYAEETGQRELADDAETVLSASRHMQEMVARVHRRTDDLTLHLAETDLGGLVERTVAAFQPALGERRIDLACDASSRWRCRIDEAQVGEALNNLVANAVEAVGGGDGREGKVQVRLTEGRRELTIEVRDDGPGMERAQAARALEPFYTTKRGGTNFGLGLPYAYHVMRKHGGTLQIRSRKGAGTSVYLTFPKRRVQAEPIAERPAAAERRGTIHG